MWKAADFGQIKLAFRHTPAVADENYERTS